MGDYKVASDVNNAKTIEDKIQEAVTWVGSASGAETISHSMERDNESSRELNELFRIDPDTLSKPFTL